MDVNTLNSLPSAAIVVNTDGKIVFANSAVEILFGYKQDELVNCMVEVLLPDNLSTHHPQLRTEYFRNPTQRLMGEGRDLLGKRKNGTQFFIEIGLMPLEREDGLHVIASIIDINDRKCNERILNDSQKRLTAELKELEEFSYIASHDLKAPLRAIANLATWIEEDIQVQYGNINNEIKSNLKLMSDRVKRMENLINGILEYSRIGRMHLNKELVDMENIAHEVMESIDLRGIKVEIGALPKIKINPIKLTQIFSNLLSNAIKYHNKEEDAWVKIYYEKNNDFHTVYIEDNGPGIDPAYHDKIFKIFQTIEPKDKTDSTGVGLAVVKKVIEQDGGSIQIQSELGYGCKFIINWPIKEMK